MSMKTKKIAAVLVSVTICVIVGMVSGSFNNNTLDVWYPILNKSPLTPPAMVFPIVWTLLYISMGVSIGWLMVSENIRKADRRSLFLIFTAQLVFNFAWSIFFFYMRNPLLSLVDILFIDFFALLYAVKAYPISRFSAILFFPYLLWILFATYLNGYIVWNN